MFNSGHQAMTFKESYVQSKKIASFLRHVGVEPGDTVAIDLPASLHLLFALAVFHEAAIGCMVPSNVGAASLLPDWLFTASADARIPCTSKVTVDSKALALIAAQPTNIVQRRYTSTESVCRLVFSSGTTGRPKPVGFTVEMIEQRAQAAQGFWMHNPPFMSLLDVGTVSGFQTFYASIQRAQTYIVPGVPSHNLAQINRHHVRSIKASPAQIAALVNESERSKVGTPSLQVVQFAGTALPPMIARRARMSLGVEIHNLYGSTETGTVAARYEDSDDPTDAGQVMPGAQVQIVDDADCPLPPGEIGKIRYRRDYQADSYFGEPHGKSSAFKNGWFYPGDNGSLTADGKLRLAGRTSEIINAGGVKIDPAIVDAVAIEVKGVRDAGGFAYEDGQGMVQFHLAVVIDSDFDAQELVDRLELEFGSARPSTILAVTQIPRNAMGKVLRKEIADRVKD